MMPWSPAPCSFAPSVACCTPALISGDLVAAWALCEPGGVLVSGTAYDHLQGRLGQVPVLMVGATAHQLIAGRVLDIAPSFDNTRVPPMLHHWLDGDIVSGYYPWPDGVDAERIDKSSNMEWDDLKDHMRGAMK